MPPWRQGLVAHSFRSRSQRDPVKPGRHVHLKSAGVEVEMELLLEVRFEESQVPP